MTGPPKGHPLWPGAARPTSPLTAALQEEPQGRGGGGFFRHKQQMGRRPPVYLLCQCFGEGSEVGLSCSVHRVVDVRGDRFRPPKPRFCFQRKRGTPSAGSRSSYREVPPAPEGREERTLTWEEGYSTGRGFLCTLVMTLQSGKEGSWVSAPRATGVSRGTQEEAPGTTRSSG